MAPPPATLISRLKVHLKLSISRLRIVQQKDQAIAKQQRRAMAALLEQGKTESARIRVENIIRSDLTTELHEILELYCELLLARIGLLEAPPPVDPGLEEAVKSIVYAAPRTDIKELQQTRALLVAKFGKEFETETLENREGKVPERVLRKLRVEPPEQGLVESYLREIADAYDVAYGDEKQEENGTNGDGEDDDDEPGSGGQAVKASLEPLATAELTTMTPPRNLGPKSPVSIAPPSPSTDNANPKVRIPGAEGRPLELKPNAKMKKSTVGGLGNGAPSPAASNVKKPDGDIPDVNDLAARFSMLKR